MKTDDKVNNNHDTSADSELRVMEERIRPEVIQEFFDLLESGRDEAQYTGITSKLLGLAKSGSIESLRELEKIIAGGNLEGKESDFAKIALNFCRFKVENELSDVEMDLISGGMGGTENRLRYFVALTSNKGLPADHMEDMEMVFRKVLKKKDSVLEEITDHKFYVSVLILGSNNYAIGNILDEFFQECPYLSSEYYLTNCEIPADDRIRDWLDGKLDDEPQYPKT
jgi:hypothetical protein